MFRKEIDEKRKFFNKTFQINSVFTEEKKFFFCKYFLGIIEPPLIKIGATEKIKKKIYL